MKRVSMISEIKASEAYEDSDAVQTVIDGKRDLAFVVISAQKLVDPRRSINALQLAINANLNLMPVPGRTEGVAFVVYKQNKAAAKKLADYAAAHDGYLSDSSPEEARYVGKLLGYDDADIEAFVNRIYKKELAMSEKVKGADGKACWKGYRYAGTEDGKDKCVKIGERVIYQNESLGIEIVESDKPFPILEAEYQGRDVELGQVKRGGNKKFYVYVKDPKTKNVKKVSFGDTTGLSIKTKDPEKRKSFRARHNCDNPGPKTKARYWSCRMWSGPDAVEKMLK